MIHEGARENQIITSGWGSDRPLARPEDHAANRRLELEYLQMDMAQAL
jgi:peptidoglycan-associated lipoprotein